MRYWILLPAPKNSTIGVRPLLYYFTENELWLK